MTIKPDEGYTGNLWCLGNILINLKLFQGFLGGSVVKNLPANAGDTGLIPGPGRFHMQQSNHNEWSNGFPYFLQYKSEFGNKEFMI